MRFWSQRWCLIISGTRPVGRKRMSPATISTTISEHGISGLAVSTIATDKALVDQGTNAGIALELRYLDGERLTEVSSSYDMSNLSWMRASL